MSDLSPEETLDRAEALIRGGEGAALVATLNLDHLRLLARHAGFRAAYARAALVVPDGMPVVWAARLAGRPAPRERVTGTTLVEGLVARGWPTFLLGAEPGVGARAANALRARFPGAAIAGVYAPPMGSLDDPREVDRIFAAIEAARPAVVFAALGAPRQEIFGARHAGRLSAAGVRLYAGIGGVLDFAAGERRRAPPWVQRLGLEWLHRAALEPHRLVPRYAADLAFVPWLLREVARARRAGRR